MNDILTAMVILAPITIALTEGAKIVIGKALDVNRFAPVISVGFGVGVAFLFPPGLVPVNEVATGVLSGLAASGLYSATKATVLGQ